MPERIINLRNDIERLKEEQEMSFNMFMKFKEDKKAKEEAMKNKKI
jgi:hypothetical protein